MSRKTIRLALHKDDQISTDKIMFDIVHRHNCTPVCPQQHHPHHLLPYDPSVGYFPWGMVDGKEYPRRAPSLITGVSTVTLERARGFRQGGGA